MFHCGDIFSVLLSLKVFRLLICSHVTSSLLTLCVSGDGSQLTWELRPGLTGSAGVPAPQRPAWVSEHRSGQQCAGATRDIGELRASDYHMLAVIKTASRNLWLANTGLGLDIRFPSFSPRFLWSMTRSDRGLWSTYWFVASRLSAQHNHDQI